MTDAIRPLIAGNWKMNGLKASAGEFDAMLSGASAVAGKADLLVCPPVTLVAAFDVVLHAETGRTDIVMGTDVANRRHAMLESLVGFFVNQLVLRVDLRGDPSFAELLAGVRAVTLGAYDHQDVPFERLVEELRPARDAGRQPLFQLKLVLQNTPTASLALRGLTLQPFAVTLRETIVDLAAQTLTGPDGTVHRFAIEPDRRQILLEGLDAIGMTLLHEPAIKAFQQRDGASRPWVYRSSI